MTPRISIVMPVWNGEKYLREAIDSILLQSFQDFEFIAVDDGSTDSTPQILKSYSDPRLRIVRINHGGLVTALNAGVDAARAEWIARQDADDYSVPHRLDLLWRATRDRRQPILIHSDVQWVKVDGEILPSPHVPSSRALLALKMCYHCPIIHTSVIFRKTAFVQTGGYLQEEYYAEDYGLWMRMLDAGCVLGLKEKLLRFRVHPASFTKNLNAAQYAVSDRMSVQYTRGFLRLDESSAQRAFRVLILHPSKRPVSEWLWFLTRCAPRARWQSLEMWLWLFSQTIRRLKRKEGRESLARPNLV